MTSQVEGNYDHKTSCSSIKSINGFCLFTQNIGNIKTYDGTEAILQIQSFMGFTLFLKNTK